MTSSEHKPHSVRPQIALNTLKALLDMEPSERVMAVIEDPSLLDFVGDLVEQLEALREAAREVLDYDSHPRAPALSKLRSALDSNPAKERA